MRAQPPIFVLDSFALLAFFRREPAEPRVGAVLGQAEAGELRLSMSLVNVGEVVYRTIREHGSDRAEEVLNLIDSYVIDLVEVDRELALAAAVLKGRYRMSYADCIAAALALQLGATVMTGDPEFRQVAGVVEVEWLPRAT